MIQTRSTGPTLLPSEQVVIQQLKAGDSTNFHFLYDMHKRRVYSLCLRMLGNQAIAEELTQEVFLLVLRRVSIFRGESAFSTWLHRLAVNAVLMHLRKQKSRRAEVLYEDFTPADAPPPAMGAPDQHLSIAHERIAMTRAIEQLPPGYRLVFVLHDIEGYEHTEIAEMLGCSVGNTKSQLHKARMKMRSLLQGTTRQSARQGQLKAA